MSLERWAEAAWYGEGAGAAAARAGLAPLAALFRAGAVARGRLYDAGVLRAHDLAAPALSIGNLTVGGTGKTPVAAWAVAELVRRGVRPAVLLRGVGGDEARVHALLNPRVPVVADPDRVRGALAAVRAGAEVLVLDDAFQHRRARRDADVVLVAAERFARGARVLPAGPFREPVSALRRATMIVVTRKSASPTEAGAVAASLGAGIGGGEVAVATAHLAPDSLALWGATEVGPVDALAGQRVLAVAGVGAPDAFAEQLRAVGARVELARYPDHHAYTQADAEALAERSGAVLTVVTTLKDAVKLGPLWPVGACALWYVTQRVTLEAGAAALADVLDGLAAAARRARRPPDGPAPPTAQRGRDP